MPMRKPRADESQESWNDYCFSELKDSDLDQSQKIAICLNAWRDRNKGVKAAERWTCGASRDLPIVETPRNWERAAAALRMLDHAKIGEDGAQPGLAKRGFLLFDSANPELRGSYSGAFADIIDGKLVAVPDGLRSAARRLPQTQGVSQEAKDRARGVLDAYFGRMNGDEKSLARTKQVNSEDIDVPEPEDDEGRSEFVDRCVDEVMDQDVSEEHASSLCALAWENRSGSMRLRHKIHAEAVTSDLLFTLSDETPDRMGDVISAKGWELTNFLKNPCALFNHRADWPIGIWQDLRVEDNSLRGRLKLAPEGTSDRIDEIRKLVEAGILKAVSVGFKPIHSQPRRVNEKTVGEHFIKQELVETSLVSVPANPNALAVAKSLDISAPTRDLVFGGIATGSRVKASGVPGELAVIPRKEGGVAMSALTQRIEKTQSHQVQLQDEIKDLLATMDETNVSDAEMQRLHDLNAEHAKGERELVALKDSERILFTKNAEDTHRQVAVRQTNGGNGGAVTTQHTPMAKPYLTTTRSPTIPKTRDERLDLIARAGVVSAIAHGTKLNVEMARNVVADMYPRYGDDGTKAFVNYVARAVTDPAHTSVTSWAEELVQTMYGDYMDLLYPDSVLPKLSAQGLSLNFGRAGRISLPTRLNTPSISGSFVGEGQPIPVRRAAFQAIVLVPKKVAMITTFTREISEASVPAIEGVLRSAIQEDTAMTLDSCLLDTDPSDLVRPAGLLNTAALPTGSGAVAVTPSTAATRFERVIEDVEALTGTLMGTHGHVRKMLYIMNPNQTLRLSLTALPGVSTFPFLDQVAGGRLLDSAIIKSGTVPNRTVVAVDAADFVLVGGEAPRFEVSDQATIHEVDGDPGFEPQPITGGTPSPAVPVRSLWQTDSLGLRLVLPVNWSMRREGMVAFMQLVNW